MSPEELQVATNRVVGMKETKKALEQGRATRVYVARDAEEAVVRPVIELSEEKSVPVVYVTSMARLGRVCGIAVGAATAAIAD